MTRLFFIFGAVVFAAAGIAFASVHRVIVTKDTQMESGIEFSLAVDPIREANDEPREDGYSRFTLSIPPGQSPFEHLWRTELWILDQEKKSVVLSVPVAMRKTPAGSMTGELSLSSRFLKKAILALRCGKRAPLSETIYQVELKSYVRSTSPSETGPR